MKGLLTKEFYVLRKGIGALYAAMILLFAVMGAVTASHQQWFIAVYPGLLIGMLPINLMFQEETEKWDQFSLTLPVTRSQLVSAKYLDVTLLTLIYAVLTLIFQLAAMAIRHSFDPELLMYFLSNSICTPLLQSALSTLPVFALGAVKGRWVGATLGALAAIGIMVPQMLAFGFSDSGSSFSAPLLGISVLISLLLFLGSWALSIKLYSRRDI